MNWIETRMNKIVTDRPGNPEPIVIDRIVRSCGWYANLTRTGRLVPGPCDSHWYPTLRKARERRT